MKLVLVIRTLPFAVLDFISGLHNMNMDKMFPNSPRMPTIGMTTPRITNVRTDPEIYGIFSQKFRKIFINLICPSCNDGLTTKSSVRITEPTSRFYDIEMLSNL